MEISVKGVSIRLTQSDRGSCKPLLSQTGLSSTTRRRALRTVSLHPYHCCLTTKPLARPVHRYYRLDHAAKARALTSATHATACCTCSLDMIVRVFRQCGFLGQTWTVPVSSALGWGVSTGKGRHAGSILSSKAQPGYDSSAEGTSNRSLDDSSVPPFGNYERPKMIRASFRDCNLPFPPRTGFNIQWTTSRRQI